MVRSVLIDSNQHEKKGPVNQKNHLNYTLHYKTRHLTFCGMVKVPEFINSKKLDVTSSQSLHCLKVRLQDTRSIDYGLYLNKSNNKIVGPAYQ